MKFFHKHHIQKRFSDIDMLGHVTNSIYQQYFDLGRLHYFSEVLNEKMDWQDEGLILVSININFMAQVKLYEDIEVKTKIVKLGNKSLEMHQQIFNLTTQSVAAESKSIMVGYQTTLATSIPIPLRWRKSIAKFEIDTDYEL
ncbi:MAG TPA: acyl-CoA thioesterase [Bacteroidales bacterium]|jgi:acyl-CoA thioester hydrolase|nr:acyl-CoA thioesterase [Bacteroidales bacterium]